jgi:beta-1,4-mannosyl-glycoprotein beta-1,4-N-acetylglucosaminyltransferase
VSDLDEIPRPATLTLLRNCEFPRRLTLRSKFYYYGFQWLHRGEEWAHPQATTYRGPDDTVLPQELRAGSHGINRLKHMDERGDLWNAAWHCSSCFSTVEELLTKMSSFSHVELNTDKFREESAIVDRVRHGKDLWDRFGQWYERVDDNPDVPRYIKENSEKFGYMLDRDGANAGFVDYVP